MRICYLIDNINPRHGGGRYASDLISAVKKASYNVVVLEVKAGGNLFLNAARVRKYLKDCDIIHAIDGYPYGIIAAIANKGLNKKLIITVQGTYAVAPLYSFFAGRLLRWAYKKADKIIAISRYTRDEVLKKVNLKNIEIINHGIDFEKFYKIPAESEEKFILSVGALKYRKGYHISISAFAEAKKAIPDLRYKIIGSQKDTAYFDELKNLAARHGVNKNIEFLTDLSDEKLSNLYQRAKLFILTSVNENHHFEGFGLVFLEAAAAGLPAIGTLGNGIEDAVKDGYNGFLVPQNDIETAASAIVRIMKDEKIRNEFSQNSFNWARDHDWSKVVVEYLSIYKN
ncbi:MAG: glycosyltransferase family 4 protein [bacterium]|nr:glycosyltransferase family 4 protein [bacterium]